MIDLLKLAIPFQPKYLIECLGHDHMSGVYINLEEVAKLAGITLSARSVEYDIDGDLTVTGLAHPFDSLPSHWAGVAMKIYPGGRNRHPCVEVKASPAKVLQGHNVFGSTDLELCSMELLGVLATAMPDLFALLDVANTALDWIDATACAHTGTDENARQVLGLLKNVSNKQTKASRQSQQHETTAYWNKGSRHRELKAYIKQSEFMRELTTLRRELPHGLNPHLPEPQRMKARRLAVMSDPELHRWLIGNVRFEARLKQRWLAEFGVPWRLMDAIKYQRDYEQDGRNLIFDMWAASFKDLFACLEGQTMNVYDDENIHSALKLAYWRETPKGNISYSKANRLFGFYRRLQSEGYETVYRSMSRQTFHDQLKALTSVGLSKSQLQNFTGTGNNVVPLLRIINVDFSAQRPDWYVEPVSQFPGLRFGSGVRPGNVLPFGERAA